MSELAGYLFSGLAERIIAGRPEVRGQTIVVLLADTADRYITTELFAANARAGLSAQLVELGVRLRDPKAKRGGRRKKGEAA